MYQIKRYHSTISGYLMPFKLTKSTYGASKKRYLNSKNSFYLRKMNRKKERRI